MFVNSEVLDDEARRVKEPWSSVSQPVGHGPNESLGAVLVGSTLLGEFVFVLEIYNI